MTTFSFFLDSVNTNTLLFHLQGSALGFAQHNCILLLV